MSQIFIIYGMKRCGNHGIINWLKCQRRFVFCNNMIPVAPILKGLKTIPEPENFDQWLHKRYVQKIKGDQFPCNFNDPYDCKKIVSLEDHNVTVRPFVTNESMTNVLIIRDPQNMFASRLRRVQKINHPSYPEKWGVLMTHAINLWKSHAREYLGHTNHLNNKVCIYFNQWFKDQQYRKKISEVLGLNFNNRGFGIVSKEGGGSSFDGVSKNGENYLMKVLNRKASLTIQEQKIIERIMQDNEIIDLFQAIQLKTTLLS